MHTDEEGILLVKPIESGDEAVKERLAELHSYDAPVIERFDDADVSAEFADCVGPTG